MGTLLIKRGDEVLAGGESTLRHQLASVSKQFTAAAVLLLAQEGRLAPEDPLEKWFPGWAGVTLHHLLSHTSGIGHWHDYPMFDLEAAITPAEALATFRSVPPLSGPGQRFAYSSPGYHLLARVVEEVAGEPYREFLGRRLFAPAGMTRTFAGAAGDAAEVAAGHDADGDPMPSWDLDVLGMGAGDVWSTTTDVVTWFDRLRAGAVLGEPWCTLMTTERVAIGAGNDFSSGYGYGFFTGAWHGEPWFMHTGHNAGYKVFAACLPRSDRRAVLLYDTEAPGQDDMIEVLERSL